MSNTPLANSNSVAFKEWAAVCAALDAGRQSIILRKGGIHEGRDGFRVAHHQFWLYPTNFHQAADSLSESAAPYLSQVQNDQPPSGTLQLRLFADVREVIELHDEATTLALRDCHVWSEATVRQRFHYKQPGLFLLIVRMYRLPAAIELAESPHFAGCRSWVDLPDSLPTAALQPVLEEQEFERQIAIVQRIATATKT